VQTAGRAGLPSAGNPAMFFFSLRFQFFGAGTKKESLMLRC
jgi:hypothetical protein